MSAEKTPAAGGSAGASNISTGDESSITAYGASCPSCMEFFLRGHLEGQAHAWATDEDLVDKVARRMRALELEHEVNREVARRAMIAIDIHTARSAPGSTYVPMRRADGAP